MFTLRKRGFFLFDSHSKDENGRMSATNAVFLLTFYSLQSLESYVMFKITMLWEHKKHNYKFFEKWEIRKCNINGKISSRTRKKMNGARERYYEDLESQR